MHCIPADEFLNHRLNEFSMFIVAANSRFLFTRFTRFDGALVAMKTSSDGSPGVL